MFIFLLLSTTACAGLVAFGRHGQVFGLRRVPVQVALCGGVIEVLAVGVVVERRGGVVVVARRLVVLER